MMQEKLERTLSPGRDRRTERNEKCLWELPTQGSGGCSVPLFWKLRSNFSVTQLLTALRLDSFVYFVS